MNIRELASMIAKREGKKHQASVGDVREILKIFFDLLNDKDYGPPLADLINAEIDRREKVAETRRKK